jgi:uncharacterized membrane protein YcaP (DUF421 family)
MPINATELLVPGIHIVEKLLRTLVVYFFLLGGLRLAGKRELGHLNPFDLVVLLLLANTVQNAIIGPDDSLTGGLIGAAALLIINWVVVRFLYSHPGLDKIVEGESDCLILDGKVIHENLMKETITLAELQLAARKQGFQSLDEIQTAQLEVGGALTFVPKRPTGEEARHRELVTRLESLAAAQSELATRIDALRPDGAS